MDLRDLDVFIAVVEEKSFRAASERLFLSQPAVSRRLQHLEAEVGVQLVRRTAPVGPTRAGELLYARVSPLVDALRSALEAVKAYGGREVHVGYVSPAIVSLVPALLGVLRSRPGVLDVGLHEMSSVDVRSGLYAGRLTLGFMLSDAADEGLDFQPLQAFRYAIALPSSDELAQRSTLQASELGSRTFLTLANHEPVHARVLEQLSIHAPGLRHQDAFGFSQIQHLVASGLGFAAVPAGLVDQPLPGITVVEVDPPLPAATVGIAALRPAQGELVTSCFAAMRAQFQLDDPLSDAERAAS